MTTNEEAARLESLFNELQSKDDVEVRKLMIFHDSTKKRPRYQAIAASDPYRFFKLLGGKLDNVMPTHNWAYEYSFDDYLEDQIEAGDEYNRDSFEGTEEEWNEYQQDLQKQREAYDEEAESIKRANELGSWYETGLYIVKGKNGLKLPFEFAFNEGYRDRIIGTPYNTPLKGRSHGILFD